MVGTAPVQSPHMPCGVQVQKQPQSAAVEHTSVGATHLVPSLLQLSPEGQAEVVSQIEQLPATLQVWMEEPAHWV